MKIEKTTDEGKREILYTQEQRRATKRARSFRSAEWESFAGAEAWEDKWEDEKYAPVIRYFDSVGTKVPLAEVIGDRSGIVLHIYRDEEYDEVEVYVLPGTSFPNQKSARSFINSLPADLARKATEYGFKLA